MLVIKIELWPGGDESRASLVSEARLFNDGSHPDHPRRGNYEVRLGGQGRGAGRVWRRGRVENFARRSVGPWELLRRALNSALKGCEDDHG